MFKRDPKACFEPSIKGFFKPRKVWHFKSGKLKTANEMSDEDFHKLTVKEHDEAVLVMHESATKKSWWTYQGEIYCEDEGLSSLEVTTLVLEKIKQHKRKIQRAQARLVATSDIAMNRVRESIPDDIKVLVWQRDYGKCVRCGSNQNLEFDHIIPFAKGGSHSARNLQLLCEACNREKSDNLV